MLEKKMKKFDFPINFKDKSKTLSGLFYLEKKEVDSLMGRFQENIKKISEVNPKFSLPEVILAASRAARSQAELAYIFFRVGREHEQQNMIQAAQYAEKVLAPKIKLDEKQETAN